MRVTGTLVDPLDIQGSSGNLVGRSEDYVILLFQNSHVSAPLTGG